MFRFLPLVLLFLPSCISLPRSFHALNYRDQKVFIDRHHYYSVGPLSSAWQKTKNQNPGIIFRHSPSGATLATEAICGAAFEDLSLTILTNHLLVGLENVQKTKEEEWSLSGRKALYTQAQASLDGVPVLLNLVVIKKDRCQFDFMGVAPPKWGEAVTKDFIHFVEGFDYR